MQSSGDGGNSGDSLGHPHNALSMEGTRLHRTRELIRGRIFHLLRQRHHQPINDALLSKLQKIAKRLEEGLFMGAHTKDGYMNLGTLDQRLHIIMVQIVQQQRQNVNSSPSVGSMMPTPGTRNTSMTAANSSMPPTTVDTGSQLPTGGVNGGSFSGPEDNNSSNLINSFFSLHL